MNKIEIIEKNILDIETQYIAHQCNCMSTSASGVARAIFDAYPYSNIYKDRTHKSIKDLPNKESPGNIIVVEDVINMLAQVYPGSPVYPTGIDSYTSRLGYFKQCLDKILLIEGLSCIAFPYKIGCGLAGGNWDDYSALLESFAEQTHAKVILAKID